MNEERLEALLSQAMDEDLSPEDRAMLDQALEESEALVACERDLQFIKDAGADPAPHPSPSVLLSLQEKVDAAYGPEKKSLWSWFSFQPMLAAALLLLLISSPFAWQYLNQSNEVDVKTAGVDHLLQNVNLAQQQYHQAIMEMETLAIQRLEEMPAVVALDYAENLRIINQAIAQCEAMLEANDREYQVYASLSRAYQSKVTLLERILEG